VKTKEKEMQEERNWSYKNFQIREGLKPGSNHLQYFFVVSEGGEKKCNYCVWIDDQALSRFPPSREFDEIVSSGRGDWSKWVQAKIDQGDFRNRVLKFEKTGQKEIDLTEMEKKLEFK
jgi:hypothetical protein